MPSFVVHTICGDKLLKHLNVNNEDKIKFLIGNILPDTKTTDIPDDIDEITRRNIIQKMKSKNHFRIKKDVILEYPDLKLFLNKYESLVKNDINALAYCFHLYTDAYYFKTFLPQFVTFLDKDGKEVTRREDIHDVLIHKTNKKMSDPDFWSKYNEEGIYREYSRSNKFLLNKYPLSFDIKTLQEYLHHNEYKVDIEEINSSKALEGIDKLEEVITHSLKTTNNNLYIFTIDELSNLIENIVSSFINEYGYLLNNYQK